MSKKRHRETFHSFDALNQATARMKKLAQSAGSGSNPKPKLLTRRRRGHLVTVLALLCGMLAGTALVYSLHRVTMPASSTARMVS